MKVVANLDLQSTSKAVNVVNPTSAADIATKNYVDSIKNTSFTVSVITSSTNYTPPANCKFLKIVAVGAGGGGGGADVSASTSYTAAGGGGGGATVIAWIRENQLLSYYNVSVSSSGGSGGSTTGSSGQTGTSTIIRTPENTVILTAGGGSAGVGSLSNGTASAGGNGGTGSVNPEGIDDILYKYIFVNGGDGDNGYVAPAAGYSKASFGGFGGNSYLGEISKSAAWYIFYGSSPTNSGGETGATGTNYGGGGGGGCVVNTTTGRAGGAGGPGIVIIEEYY